MAADHLQAGEIAIMGCVQDYLPGHASSLLDTLRRSGVGTIGEQYLLNELGNRLDQITIVTDKLESYTAFIAPDEPQPAPKDMIMARLRGREILGLPKGKNAVFLCDDFWIIRVDPD
ncbi:MAG: hypothetical protein KDH09_17985 [Chrysiogenetes bacterium]|nr:hypothetical protein [Chrysiogenetes bacterium]